MSDREYDGPDRRLGDRRAGGDSVSLVGLAQEVGEIAAQKVARIHRRRLVTQSFLAGLVAAAAIAIPVTVIVNANRAHDARRFAVFNCGRTNALTDVAKSFRSVFEGFISSDAKLREEQRNFQHRAQVEQALHKIIAPKVLRDIEAQSLAQDRATTAYWRDHLLPQLHRAERTLNHIHGLDCPAGTPRLVVP